MLGTFKKTLVLLSQAKLGYTDSCILFLETLITSKLPIQPKQLKKKNKTPPNPRSVAKLKAIKIQGSGRFK